MKCKYNDCGWCYAPKTVETNDNGGQCGAPIDCKERNDQLIEVKEIDTKRGNDNE